MLTRQNLLQRLALVAALLAAATVALAQQPLVVPHYYAFQLAELQPGADVAGELTESDGQNFKDGSRVDLYVLDAVAGELESVRVVSGAFEPVVSVFGPDGSLMAYADYGPAFGDVTATFTASASGRHVVVVSGWSDYDLGGYTVTRVQTTGGAGSAEPVTLPFAVESLITVDMAPLPGGYGGGAELFSFAVEEETLLVASMSSTMLDAVLTLFDDAGDVVARNDDDGYSTDAMLVALLEPGSYVIAASTYFSGEAGDYSLRLETYFPR